MNKIKIVENLNDDYLDKIKEIYLSSFPKDERIDFEDLRNRRFPNSKILAFLLGEKLIGFSFISVSEKFIYIVYLAISEKDRNANYGTTALKMICDAYQDKAKVLCVERPNENNDIKVRRINFYRRNGFELADFEFKYYGQSYYSMYKGDIDENEFIEYLKLCFPGCEDFKSVDKEFVQCILRK